MNGRFKTIDDSYSYESAKDKSWPIYCPLQTKITTTQKAFYSSFIGNQPIWFLKRSIKCLSIYISLCVIFGSHSASSTFISRKRVYHCVIGDVVILLSLTGFRNYLERLFTLLARGTRERPMDTHHTRAVSNQKSLARHANLADLSQYIQLRE
ncbi:uncharacterized protein LOC113298290 [Papaver somniferum]|uniref:uncharacterized protein LOC113298290 n=1 Tax=Papaver somniferum TaxID=3469 RepID=UPI000E6F6555|nr:uncharacterized protein LOC113298290 [Papaver somniferum]